MSNYEATKYDFDGANLTGIEGIPTATIVPWSSASVPSGFLECNGKQFQDQLTQLYLQLYLQLMELEMVHQLLTSLIYKTM